MAVAAAGMSRLLIALRPGPWWLAGLLGTSYGLCGWALADAVYNPMWLDGLIAFPLLCLAGEWLLDGRRLLPGPARRRRLDRQLQHRVHGHPTALPCSWRPGC